MPIAFQFRNIAAIQIDAPVVPHLSRFSAIPRSSMILIFVLLWLFPWPMPAVDARVREIVVGEMAWSYVIRGRES